MTLKVSPPAHRRPAGSTPLMRISSISRSSPMTDAKFVPLRVMTISVAALRLPPVSCPRWRPRPHGCRCCRFRAVALPLMTKVSPTPPSVPPLTTSRPSVAACVGVPDERVVAGVAVEDVRSRTTGAVQTAGDRVIAGTAVDRVVAGEGIDRVVAGRAVQRIVAGCGARKHGARAPASVKSVTSMLALVTPLIWIVPMCARLASRTVSRVLAPPTALSITRVAKLAAVMPRPLRSMRSWVAGVPPVGVEAVDRCRCRSRWRCRRSC